MEHDARVAPAGRDGTGGRKPMQSPSKANRDNTDRDRAMAEMQLMRGGVVCLSCQITSSTCERLGSALLPLRAINEETVPLSTTKHPPPGTLGVVSAFESPSEGHYHHLNHRCWCFVVLRCWWTIPTNSFPSTRLSPSPTLTQGNRREAGWQEGKSLFVVN